MEKEKTSKKQETVEVGSLKNKLAENKTNETAPKTEQKVQIKPKFVPTQDALENKNIAWLAYLLFFIPLLINAKSPFVRHHANEGLEINIFDAIGLTLLLIGTLVTESSMAIHGMLIIFVFVGCGLLVLTTITKIYMIVTTLQGKQTNTPWMWNLKIIK